MNILLFAALTGCAPDHADVDGDWFAWLAAGSSPTIQEDELSMSDATIFECSGRGWDADTCMFDPGYIGPKMGGFSDSDEFIGGACAQMNDAGNYNPNDGKCDGAYAEDCTAEDVAAFTAECDEIRSLEKNRWIIDDGYYALTGDLDAWRSEALINSEGDLQLTIHVDLGDDQDFRYVWSIDPDFAPDDCLENEDGELYRAFSDGSSWVQEWSEDEDGNLVYYLNAGSYQVDPTDSENSWYLSDDMVAGYSHAKFAAEEFSSHPGEYGHYDLDGSPLPWGTDALSGGTLAGGFLGVDVDGHAGGIGFAGANDYVDWHEQYQANFESLCATVKGAKCANFDGSSDKLTWEEEMVLALGAVKDSNGDGILDDGDARFEHKIEGNMWRPIDNTISGIDGWMEVHSSWVRLKTGQTVAPDETVAGDFQIFFEGSEAGSRLLVRGAFEITELDMDRWGYDILEDVKREENGTPYCGGAKAPQ